MSMQKSGLSMYFRSHTIRLRHRTIAELDYPEYIHLRINKDRKQMFIQKCDKDKNAFHLVYRGAEKGIHERSCYIQDTPFLRYLSGVVGVPEDSRSIWFKGYLLDDGKTYYIDLTNYEYVGLEPKYEIDTSLYVHPSPIFSVVN